MAALKPYPHYEINVKDNSIYTFSIDETLPVHRALWVLRTQEGPVGEPVWCANASKLKKVFGEQTLNMANPKFAAPQSFFLVQTMASNGAFIVRALDDSARYATAILEATVTTAQVEQYQKDTDPTSETYGKRLVDNAEEIEVYNKTTDTVINASKTYYTKTSTESGDTYTAVASPTVSEIANYYEKSVVSNPNYGEYKKKTTRVQSEEGGYVDQVVTEAGYLITFTVRKATKTELSNGLESLQPQAVTGGTKYPIMAFQALNKGEYGNDLAFRLFYKKSENDAANAAFYGTIFNSLSVARREYNSTTTNLIYDIYGRGYNTFAADPDCADPETGVQMGMDSIITNAFDTESSDGTDFPYTVYTFEENLKAIGAEIIAKEAKAADGGAAALAFGEFGYTAATQMNGYQINVLGGTNINGDTYDHVAIKGRNGGALASDAGEVLLDQDVDVFLADGFDGTDLQTEDKTTGAISELGETARDNFVDHFMYRFLKLYVNPKIVDKFRYPMTHIYDPGYSMTTKYAMIDFLDTRDDVAVELATQVLFPNTWATKLPKTLSLNDQAKDIADGLVLRERALLMRESILKGTDCMRCSIYTQAGKPVAATYNKPVPFTFWSAIQHAKYGNTDQMSTIEPRGLPYSYNELFKTWNWTNYSELLKEKTWDAGLNYCQYADMTRIFYPALRTVYRAETSVLVDQWVVDALVYTKHECRKAWARFSGRNDKQAILEAEIKNYLEEKLSYLYNGKYDFVVTVYKTDEEQNIGYIEHVKLKLVFPATMRVMNFDIEVNREGYENSESEA